MDAANSWNLPVPQAPQLFSLADAYWPAPQVLHTAVANVFWFWYCPLMQLVQTVDFELNFFPAAQNLQDTESTVFCSWYLPVSHTGHAIDIEDHSVPAAHCLHTAVANVFCSWYFPLPQNRHETFFVLNFFPAAQNLQRIAVDTALFSWYLPSGQSTQAEVLHSCPTLQVWAEDGVNNIGKNARKKTRLQKLIFITLLDMMRTLVYLVLGTEKF